MNLDIHAAVIMAVIITILGAFYSIWSGVRAILKGRKVTYYRLSRLQVGAGWRAIFFAVTLVVVAFLLGRFGEPMSYRYFIPSPTPSPTQTISQTPTITTTPTISLTPSFTPTLAISYTPTATGTPFLPIVIEAQFISKVTPNPAAVFSPLIFSLTANNFKAVSPQTVFQNPIKEIYVTYSYDEMVNGSQWTAIWYLNGQLLKYKTISWDSGTGGYGQDTLNLPTEQWLPGIYRLIFFVGTDWKVQGEFRIMGNPPTLTISPSPSLSRTPTMTPTVTLTRLPTWTPHPTDTRWPSPTSTR